MIRCTSPIEPEQIEKLKAGDIVLLSGVVYTARDAAHARLCKTIAENKKLPVDIRKQTIFYAGPAPTPPGKVSGAIGPTTSVRMDAFTPMLLDHGLRAIIGKGDRSDAVKQSIMEHKAVYFAAPAGCAAYLSSCIESIEVVAYEDLGTESVKRIVLRDLPLTVAIDSNGEDFYEQGPNDYLQTSQNTEAKA